MSLLDYFLGLRQTFASNRGRSALTLLGIIIGTGSIVLLAGLLRSGEEALVGQSQRANEADLIQIRTDEPPQKQANKTRRELGRGDRDTLEEARLLSGITVAGENGREVQAFYRESKKNVRIVSATPGSESLYRLTVERGHFLSADDLSENRRVAVVGNGVYHDLLEEAPSLDNIELLVDGHLWNVVGVLKKKQPLGGGGDGTWKWDYKILVPQTSYDALYNPSHGYNGVYVRAASLKGAAGMLSAIESTVESVLLRHHLGVHNFKVAGEKSEAHQEQLIFSIIKMLMFSTALLALFVGGINIMNIMLVTVTERTREIGVRRAIGAPPRSILLQFLFESAAISTAGGLVGVVAGVGLLGALTLLFRHLFGEWSFHIEMWSIAIGLLLSLVTGIVFGLFPAWRAAKLDPVEALRFE